MPEIKHNFTTGKMNKDLDERLVQNGEYRDAINIQVSTSDETDVGSVQNILGNKMVANISYLNDECVCIGSIADEKNNKIYWFVFDTTDGSPKSYILQYDKTSIKPVFVDTDNSVLKFSVNKITGINIINDLLFFTDGTNEPKKINIQRSIDGTDASGTSATEITDYSGTDVDAKEENITVIKKSPINAPTIQYNYFRDPTLANIGFINIANIAANPHTFINSSRGRIHDFSTIKIGDTFDTIIETDENFSNDFTLSWQAGTDVILKAFNLDNTPPSLPLQDYDLKGYITDWNNNEFANTISPFPIENTVTQTPSWTFSGTANDYYFDSTSGTSGKKLVHYFYSSGAGNLLLDSYKYRLSFELAEYNSSLQGRVLIRLHDNTTGSSNYYEIDLNDLTASDAGVYDFTIPEQSFNNTLSQYYPNAIYFEAATDNSGNLFNGAVKNVELTRIDVQIAKVRIKVTSIAGTPPAVPAGETILGYAIDLYEDVESLFDLKFARFAYRYKYADNEYSCFSPFSNAVFSPGSFAYHPVEGYNIGMENTVKDVTLKNLNDEMPDDVVAIDILYKEDDSTAVYLVDTIKTSLGLFDYNITNDTAKGILPENQLLRVYDNVPITAKAQEVLGNRVVYGNYQQNYDLEYYNSTTGENEDFNILLNTKINNEENNSSLGIPSIKSSRKYQVGVVYSDEYGRQTPVLTNSDATNEVQLLSAPEINTLQVQINSDGHPVNADYFKFYVKDIGGEYFNLAMDRWYDAEDGNVWLSFASSDRNKVEIDDYLVLKKGIDNNVVDLATKNKYKVIDIKNEAPEFIKANKMLISQKFHNNTTALLFDSSQGCEIPALNGSSFSVLFSRYNSSGLSELETLFNNRPVGDEYFIQIVDAPLSSNRYKVFNIEKTTSSPAKFIFTIEGVFGADMAQFNDDPSNSSTPTQVNDGASLKIFKERIENSPKFEGRFFVKIFRDEHYNQFISSSIENEDIEYTTSSATDKTLYYFKSKNNNKFNAPDYHGSGAGGEFFGVGSSEDAWNTGGAGGTYDAVGVFPLGESATDPPNYGNATLYKYLASSRSIIQSLADFDYDPANIGSTDPNYNQKAWNTSLGLRAWYRGINTELDPDKAASDRVLKLHLEDDRDNTKFEDVWYFNAMKNSINYPYGTVQQNGLVVSTTYPIANSSVTHSNWVDRDAYSGYSTTSVINIGFGGIEPEQDTGWASSGYSYTDSKFFDLVNHSTFAPTQGAFIKKLAGGSQFRFKEDPTSTIYTITDVTISYLVNYDNLCEDANYNDSTGIYDDPSASNVNQFLGNKNIVNAINNGNTYYDNEYDAAGALSTSAGNTAVHYRAPSFLNAYNFSVNYRLSLNKPIVWNPVGTPGSAIPGGITLTVLASTNPVGTKNATSGLAKIVLDSISGTTATGDTMSVQEGMVLHAYEDGGSTTREITKKAIVSDISFDDTTNKFTIKFRAYDGGDEDLDSGTGNGKVGDITASDNLVFKQYYMNGMCPNSAKNLNYFRKGGEALDKTGVAPLGYTMQFVTVVDEDQSELSQNPAVWETESKKDKNLDIYYEASNYYKISEDKLSEIIPVGSIIEHVESDGIPEGVTITNVTDTGDITLSEKVTVEPTISQPNHILNRF
tara:strand:+ start:3250 stop:8109 length:4860 start_codon:yes stop_codon:yes gene_type:complete